MKAVIRAAVAGCAAATAMAAMAPLAAADEAALENDGYLHQEVPAHCLGVSPNIVDMPYVGTIRTMQKLEDNGAPYPIDHGRADVSIANSISFWGYTTYAHATWHNLDTGATGALDAAEVPVGPSGPVANFGMMESGPGTVEITAWADNQNGLWTLPTTRCTGTVQVRE